MKNEFNKSWFEINGKLEAIGFKGPNDFRFPLELAEKVVREFSPESGLVLDPFAGVGTTLVASERLNRNSIGFECDESRVNFIKSRIGKKSRVFLDKAQNIGLYDLPLVDLLFTSPPYASFNGEQNDPIEIYIRDFESIFSGFNSLLKPHGVLVLEVSSVNDDRGILPLAWHCGLCLQKYLSFKGEVIRCNSGNEQAGPGFDHSYLLVFQKEK